MDCDRCNNKRWIPKIKYTGKTFENRIENGQTFIGYDSYFNTTVSIAKGIAKKDSISLYIEMSKNEELRELNKHDSVMVPCGCRR